MGNLSQSSRFCGFLLKLLDFGNKKNVQSSIKSEHTIRASFTRQGKLAWERDSKTAPMGVEISAGDLLTTRELKNTDATSHLHINQRNIPSAVQISVVANKEI